MFNIATIASYKSRCETIMKEKHYNETISATLLGNILIKIKAANGENLREFLQSKDQKSTKPRRRSPVRPRHKSRSRSPMQHRQRSRSPRRARPSSPGRRRKSRISKSPVARKHRHSRSPLAEFTNSFCSKNPVKKSSSKPFNPQVNLQHLKNYSPDKKLRRYSRSRSRSPYRGHPSSRSTERKHRQSNSPYHLRNNNKPNNHWRNKTPERESRKHSPSR